MPSLHGALLGADQFGRDVLSRMLYGLRISMLVGVAASFVGTVVGCHPGLGERLLGWENRCHRAAHRRYFDVLSTHHFSPDATHGACHRPCPP